MGKDYLIFVKNKIQYFLTNKHPLIMKTKTLEMSKLTKKNAIETLSEREMENINGGARWILLRDEDGNYRVIFYP